MASNAISGPSTPASPSSTGLEIARLLIQKVSRAFYGSKGAIIVDQLIQKEAFRDEELGKRLGMPSREVSKFSHRLIQDELVHLHRRSELKPGAPKASLRTYYYLDFSKTVDVIKWRMWKVQQTIDVKLRNELDAQGYLCPLCKASYTPLDAAQLYDPARNLLACSVCQTEVTNNENDEQVKGNKDRMQRLNRQTKGIVDLLKKLEKVELPRFDIERYLAIHGPALGATAAAQAAASGQTVAAQPNVKVHIAGDDDEAIEKLKRETELKEKRAQNMLPSWIAKSTINEKPSDGGSVDKTVGETDDRIDPEEREQGIVGQVGEPGPQASEAEQRASSGTTTLGSVDIGGFGAAMSFYEQEDQDEESNKPEVDEAGGDDLDAYYASLEAQNLTQLGDGTPMGGSSTYDSPATDGLGMDSPLVLTGAGGAEGSGTSGTPDLIGGETMELSLSGIGKRSRQDSTEIDPDASETKKFKSAQASPTLQGDTPVVDPTRDGIEEGEDEDDFDQVEGEEEENMDPNQLISVNGKMLPYSQVTEDMTSEMTADEYSAYWDVYARLNE